MKLHATDHTVIRGGNLVETNFTVRTTAKTFAILSSGLYSDKIAAPIRELCCNAYDAHVSAGNQLMPFEVTLPNALNPVFSVRDYGTGLSNDDVRNLYTTYFDSTKTNSDEMIGALGLGSKSPFAYTTSFSIESRFNGKMSTYAAFINEHGVPALSALLEDTPTNEPNGMTISFAVKSDDISKFVDRAKRVLMYFPVQPIVSGQYEFTPHSLKHTVEGTGWKIREAGYYAHMDGAYVIQGCVAYPLLVSNLSDQLSEAALAVAMTDLDLFVPIGQVEVAPSREALGYDPVTVSNLVTHLENAAAEMRVSIQTSIDACANMWQARRMIHRMSNDDAMANVFKPLHKQQPFLFNNLPIDTTISLDLNGLPSVAVEVVQVSSRYGRRGRGASVTVDINRADQQWPTISVIQQPHTVIMVDDMGKGFTGTIKAYAKTVYDRTNKHAHFVVIRPVDHKAGIAQAEMDAIKAQLGNPETVTVTSIAPAAAAKKTATYRPRKKTERLVFTGFPCGDHGTRRVFSRLTWDRREIDLDAGGFYVVIERFDIVQSGVRANYIDEMLSNGIALDLFTHTPEIVGFTEKELESIAGNPDWVNVFDYLGNGAVEFLSDSATVTESSRKQFIADNYDVSSFLDVWPGVTATVKHGEFKEFFDHLAAPTQVTIEDYRAARRICELVQISDATATVLTQVKKFDAQYRNLKLMYSMLQLINMRSIDRHNVRFLVDYINTCEDAIMYAAEHQAA